MKHIQTYQKKITNLKCVFPQFCLERENYCLFVKIQGDCPKLFFINEFLFLINCSQTHIPASFCSLAFTMSQGLSHCHTAAAAPAGWAFPAGHRGLCWLLLCPVPLQERRRMHISWHWERTCPSPAEVCYSILLLPSVQASRFRPSCLRYTFCSSWSGDSDKIKYLLNLFLHGVDSDRN